ncbi:MAG: flagellar motor protein MotD [Nitrosomonas sp.]|jgi:chemotaxis protein MotB|nr:flagellar motor protein MotD [Nitrosomonas sp.]MBP7111417.1 flagellar motor protein MotD [Nitrosomonas sp.]
MLKKKKQRNEEDVDNHERWLVSYADFITLLFAFFVVMYAVSSVNKGKYEILSHSLINAFSNNSPNLIVLQSPQTDSSIKPINELDFQKVKKQEKMKSMAKDILIALEPLVKDGHVRVTQTSLGISVEINASVLFSPGQAKLAENSSLTLQAVARVIKGHEHEIHVEGHTDNLPIHTDSFLSNWELSTARASSVIRLFVDNGVESHRFTAIGYADNRPMEANETPEGRKRNRRVTIMILSNDPDKVIEIPIAETTKFEE